MRGGFATGRKMRNRWAAYAGLLLRAMQAGTIRGEPDASPARASGASGRMDMRRHDVTGHQSP
jgi:hypothetical protein